MKLFCVTGPGNLTNDFNAWRNEEISSTESVAKTYSSEIFDFCLRNKVELLAISSYTNPDVISTTNLTCENLPKSTNLSGWRFHFEQFTYGIRLLKRARQFKADVALIDSGTCSWWAAVLFRLSGIHVVMKLHNAMWTHQTEEGRRKSLKAYLVDFLPMKLSVSAVLGVSHECLTQAKSMLGQKIPMQLFLPIYNVERIKKSVSGKKVTTALESSLTVVFSGRLEIEKGVMLFLQAAKITQDKAPNDFSFVLVGDGAARRQLVAFADENRLTSLVCFKGHLDADAVLKTVADADVLVMPTTSNFPEGLGKSMVEAALANTPSIVSRVVPAAEFLSESCIVIPEDNANEIAKALFLLSSDRRKLATLSEGTVQQKAAFFNRTNGLSYAVERILKPYHHSRAHSQQTSA